MGAKVQYAADVDTTPVLRKEDKKFITMSRWYKSKKDSVWGLSKKGTILSLDQLPSILEMYTKAIEQAKTIDPKK